MAAASALPLASTAEEVVVGRVNVVHDELPEGGFKMFAENYISMNGLFAYDPINFFNYDKENWPEVFTPFPNDPPSDFNFTFETDFFGVDGSQYVEKEELLLLSGAVIKQMAGGRYRGFKWTYWQPNPLQGPNQPERLWGSRTWNTKVFFPVVRKVPFYVAAGALEGITFKSEDKLVRYLEPASYDDFIGFHVSMVAMDFYPRMTEEEHFACPIWYEFKFMGYVDGYPDGVTEIGEASLGNLPDGVTFVPAIHFCSELPGAGGTIRGCANVGGTKVAVRMDLATQKLAEENDAMGAVLLHELLHAQGSDHVFGDDENLMTPEGVLDAPYLDQGQCEMLLKRKSVIMGLSGFEPWE